MMDKNLLTSLTRRWGNRAGTRAGSVKTVSAEVPTTISDSPLSIGLVSFSGRKNSQAYDQATNLARLIAGSGRVVNLAAPISTPDKALGALGGPARYVHELMKVIKRSELIHLIAASYLELALTACLTSVLSRFYGKRILLEVVGGWTAHINPYQLWLVRIWTGICQTVLVPAGQSDLWIRGLGVKVEESMPLVDPESISGRLVAKLQPSILADCAGLPMTLVREIIAGFEIVKQKYPRTELTLLVDKKSEFNRYRVIKNSSLAGLTVKTPEADWRIEELFEPSDLFISCRTEPFAERNLLLAAAAGKIIFVPDSSELTEFLKLECHFEPISFADRSDLADKLISLIENPDRVRFLSGQSRGLAEQFAWDNLVAVWLSRYSRSSRD